MQEIFPLKQKPGYFDLTGIQISCAVYTGNNEGIEKVGDNTNLDRKIK